ncbi:zinc-binding protein A33 [Anguilla anguilla]|uniref:zinc-binding protein A33 n=1 Tax=Anguilla anguilla TaxID=7936 RepID=UPI0015ACA021|nr:zinc-binding protein A33 [Anguilla anguilla]
MSNNHIKDTNNFCNKSLLTDHREKLIQAIKHIKHESDECWNAERETYIQSVSVENAFEDLEREVRAEYENLHRFLEAEEDMDMERLRKEREKRVKQLRERERKIADQGRDLERAIDTLNNKLKEEDSPKLLKEIKDLLKRCQVKFIPPPALNSEVRSGQFVGPLQYRIWKHMKSSLYPNISSLTFDPDTAHPLLALDSTFTSVWFEESKDAATEEEDSSPRRFTYYYCLMGREAFTHGRHYWEVEVARKTAWRVGVAREDVCRGEMDSSSVANGLWTLALKEGTIQACTDPRPTTVPVSVQPARIGVFLDCEKQEVSFYNAVTMTPLFSFSMGTLLLPVRPFFNPCDADEGKNTAPLSLFAPAL